MKLVRGLNCLVGSQFEKGCIATIGNFDGVHVGHKVIIEQVKTKAVVLGLPSVVVVFEPQPQEYFRREAAPARLMRFREKLIALRNLDVDYLVCLKFNDRLHEMSAQQFVDQVLVSALHIKHLVIGDDFKFGSDRSGDFSLLQKNGDKYGYTVENTQTVEVENARVSSTRVRQALDDNQFELAERLLGHPFAITGCVVHGRKLGRQLGVPTANVSLGRKILALKGVYAVEAWLESGDCKRGVANIGVRPTIDGVQPSLEVHLFDFNGTIYGEHLKVIFRRKIRNEQKFSDVDELKYQILKDIDETHAYFNLA